MRMHIGLDEKVEGAQPHYLPLSRGSLSKSEKRFYSLEPRALIEVYAYADTKRRPYLNRCELIITSVRIQ